MFAVRRSCRICDFDKILIYDKRQVKNVNTLLPAVYEWKRA